MVLTQNSKLVKEVAESILNAVTCEKDASITKIQLFRHCLTLCLADYYGTKNCRSKSEETRSSIYNIGVSAICSLVVEITLQVV